MPYPWDKTIESLSRLVHRCKGWGSNKAGNRQGTEYYSQYPQRFGIVINFLLTWGNVYEAEETANDMVLDANDMPILIGGRGRHMQSTAGNSDSCIYCIMGDKRELSTAGTATLGGVRV